MAWDVVELWLSLKQKTWLVTPITQMIFIGCDSGECAFKSDQPYKLVRSYLQVSHYTSQMAWDVVELWLSLKQKTWLVTPITQMIFIGCDSGECAFKSDQPYKLVRSYLQVSHYTSQMAWDVVELWLSLKQKTWLVTPITQMIFIGCDSGECAFKSDQPYKLVRSYLQVSHYTSQMAWDVVELWLSLKQKTWLVTPIKQMIFIGCDSGECAFKSDQPYKLVRSYLQVSHYTSQMAWDVVELWLSLKQKTWLVTPITQMIFIGCDSGECAFKSDQPYKLVRSYLQVSHYTSQMAWDVVELWLSLKQKTWLVTPITQMIFIGCDSGECAFKSDQPYKLVRSYLQVSHYTSQMAWDVVELWLSLKQKTWLVTPITQMIFIGCDSGECAFKSDQPYKLVRSYLQVSHYTSQMAWDVVELWLSLKQKTWLVTPITQMIFIGCDSGECAFKSDQPYKLVRSYLQVSHYTSQMAWDVVELWLSLKQKTWLVTPITQMIFIGCDSGECAFTNDIHRLWLCGECAFKSDQPYKLVRSYLQVSHYTSQMAWDVVELWLSLKQKTWLVTPITQMIFIGCDSGECAFKSDQPYKLVRSYLQVSHYTSQMAWDVVELWLSLKQKTWLVTPITQMIFIGCDSGECAFKSDQPYKLVRSYLQVSHYTSQMAWDVVELWLSLKQKTWLVTPITQMIFIGCDSGECAFKSDQPYKLVRSYLQVSHYTSQMAWDVVELWLSLKQKTWLVTPIKQMKFIGCDIGECAFLSDQSGQMVRSFLRVSYYTFQMSWDLLELWFSAW